MIKLNREQRQMTKQIENYRMKNNGQNIKRKEKMIKKVKKIKKKIGH